MDLSIGWVWFFATLGEGGVSPFFALRLWAVYDLL